MSEPHEQQSTGSEKPQSLDLGSELRELGQQLEQAFRSALENERAKNLQRDFIAGIREIGNQMQLGLSSLKDDPRVQNLAERGQQVVNQAQESPAARDFQQALARGVAQLKEQIASFNTQMQSRDVPPAGPAAQSVNIEHEEDEHPATGETTRLDSEKQD